MRQIRHPAPQSIKDAHGAISPGVTLLQGGGIHTGHAHMCRILHMKTTLKLKINMRRAYLELFIYPQKPSAGLPNLVRLSL
jgi:hypothetical protein